MRDFRKLAVWRKAHDLALAVYGATTSFPRDELFGLTSQLRRAGVSVPANIAEGCGRSSPAELELFLTMAMGSASELEYHVLLARDLRLLSDASHEHLAQGVAEVKSMLACYIQKIRATRLSPAFHNRFVEIRSTTGRVR